MTQRNPLNERYQSDQPKGQTRKSAASAKPKAKAAASVHIQTTTKSKAQLKAEKKQRRARQAELDRKYYNPPTPEYKRLRRLWWILLVGAIVATAGSWILQGAGASGTPVSYVLLGLAYALIIAALYVEFGKIRKVRRKYQEEMEGRKSKEVRAAEKKAKAEALAQAKAGAEAPAEEPKKQSVFSKLFGGKSKAASDANAESASEASADSAKNASAK